MGTILRLLSHHVPTHIAGDGFNYRYFLNLINKYIVVLYCATGGRSIDRMEITIVRHMLLLSSCYTILRCRRKLRKLITRGKVQAKREYFINVANQHNGTIRSNFSDVFECPSPSYTLCSIRPAHLARRFLFDNQFAKKRSTTSVERITMKKIVSSRTALLKLNFNRIYSCLYIMLVIFPHPHAELRLENPLIRRNWILEYTTHLVTQ